MDTNTRHASDFNCFLTSRKKIASVCFRSYTRDFRNADPANYGAYQVQSQALKPTGDDFEAKPGPNWEPEKIKEKRKKIDSKKPFIERQTRRREPNMRGTHQNFEGKRCLLSCTNDFLEGRK